MTANSPYLLRRTMALCLAVTLASAGCSTVKQTDRAGAALIGGLVGIGVSVLVGSDEVPEHAAYAGAGAVTGWLLMYVGQRNSKYYARSPVEDGARYAADYPVRGQTYLKIRGGSVGETSVRAGDTVRVSTDYSLRLYEGLSETEVSERWVLEQDGELLAEVQPKPLLRSGGGWMTAVDLVVPIGVKPGSYTVRCVIAGAELRDEASWELQVGA